jgi:short-subunit dehydrogenase
MKKQPVVVITGASSGIGFETANLLHESGATVYGLSRREPKEEYEFNHLKADVTDLNTLQVAAETIKAKEKSVDVLINCAGIGIGGAVEETTVTAYEQLFDVNVKGVFLATKVFLPLIRESEGRKIINVSSVAGVLSIPFQAFYSMSKAAILSFSEALRNEVRPLKIQVTSVLPGDTKTAFTDNRKTLLSSKDSVYYARVQKSLKKMETDEQNGRSPLSVAKAIKKLIKRKYLPVQVTIGFEYKLFIFLNRILPKRFVNWILYKMYGN